MSVAGLHSAGELVSAAAQRVHGVLELAAAEVRLAALSGLTMLLLVMIASAALIVAWGLAVACVLYLLALTAFGWPLPALGIASLHVLPLARSGAGEQKPYAAGATPRDAQDAARARRREGGA